MLAICGSRVLTCLVYMLSDINWDIIYFTLSVRPQKLLPHRNSLLLYLYQVYLQLKGSVEKGDKSHSVTLEKQALKFGIV